MDRDTQLLQISTAHVAVIDISTYRTLGEIGMASDGMNPSRNQSIDAEDCKRASLRNAVGVTELRTN